MMASSTGPRSDLKPTSLRPLSFATLDSKTVAQRNIPVPRQNGEVHSALLALLLVVLGLLVWRAATRSRELYRRFKTLTATRARRRVYARWLLESVFVMGGLTAAVLLAALPEVPRVLVDTEHWAPVAAIRGFLGTPGGVAASVVGIVLVAAVLVAPVFLLRRSVGADGVGDIPAVGDIRALLPRERGELKFGVGLGLSAGVFEELLFRLAMPALLFGILGLGPLSFLIAALIFGMLHLYQGPLGITLAALLGLVFAALYVLTGSIAAPIVLHALVDLRSLVLIPIVVGGAWRRR
jgi:membrane protease YdiL (CAAX protease family)